MGVATYVEDYSKFPVGKLLSQLYERRICGNCFEQGRFFTLISIPRNPATKRLDSDEHLSRNFTANPIRKAWICGVLEVL